MASWSPSQSLPLMVSYACHRQSSTVMLPKAALIPPCAATVCDLVGNSLVMHLCQTTAQQQDSCVKRCEVHDARALCSVNIHGAPICVLQQIKEPSGPYLSQIYVSGLAGDEWHSMSLHALQLWPAYAVLKPSSDSPTAALKPAPATGACRV